MRTWISRKLSALADRINPPAPLSPVDEFARGFADSIGAHLSERGELPIVAFAVTVGLKSVIAVEFSETNAPNEYGVALGVLSTTFEDALPALSAALRGGVGIEQCKCGEYGCGDGCAPGVAETADAALAAG